MLGGILQQVKVPYRDQLAALGAVALTITEDEVSALRAALSDLASGPALFVGSGGALVPAHVAARIHEERDNQLSRVCTPLEALSLPPMDGIGAMVFTSSAKHPDARLFLREFGRSRFRPAVVVTHQSEDEMRALAGADSAIVTLPPLPRSDGFLATGSVLQTVVGLLGSDQSPSSLADLLAEGPSDEAELRREVLVLVPPSQRAVGEDLEVRLVESGLAAVQVSDYRNFAHGRHTGYARRAAHTTVIAVSDSQSKDLASETVRLLPEDADVRSWHGEGTWPEATVRLLARSMRLAGREGEQVGLDIGRPKVPVFGRRLYRMPLTRRVAIRRAGAIDRKLVAVGLGVSSELRSLVQEAGRAWAEKMRSELIGGIVLDYDGTVCWTRRRFELPEQAVQEALLGLIEGGMALGFASGRGRSLYQDLREWVPPKQRSAVLVGLYNGGVSLRLDEPLGDLREPSPWSQGIVATLASLDVAAHIDIEERGPQVTVAGSDGSSLTPRALAGVVQEQLEAAGRGADVVVSGHSVDVIPKETSKVAILRAIEEGCDSAVLVVGDQGDVGGNDHALLAATQASLSVDRCSGDLSRCWFAGDGTAVGPDLLVRYLRALRRRKSGFRLSRLGEL